MKIEKKKNQGGPRPRREVSQTVGRRCFTKRKDTREEEMAPQVGGREEEEKSQSNAVLRKGGRN